MRYMVERNFVQVVGKGWYGQSMAYTYDLSQYDLKNIGQFTRENVAEWLTTHSGDFQSVDGWYATAGDKELPWEPEESKFVFNDLVYGAEFGSEE